MVFKVNIGLGVISKQPNTFLTFTKMDAPECALKRALHISSVHDVF